MYKKQNGNWMVGPTLGGTTGGLFNETKSDIPPCSGINRHIGCFKKCSFRRCVIRFNPNNVTSDSCVDQNTKIFCPIGQKPPILHGKLFK